MIAAQRGFRHLRHPRSSDLSVPTLVTPCATIRSFVVCRRQLYVVATMRSAGLSG